MFGQELPGGLLCNCILHRSLYFRELTGKIERRLTSQSAALAPIHTRVSDCIGALVAKIGTIEMNNCLADELSVGDRMFIMISLSTLYDRDAVWQTISCEACRKPFDIMFRRSSLEVYKPNTPTSITMDLGEGNITIRAPNGADQIYLNQGSSTTVRNDLLKRCIVDPGKLSKDQLVLNHSPIIIEHLDRISPKVELNIETECPYCSGKQLIEVEPYALLDFINGDTLNEDIHTIASHYHWQEIEILRLSRTQRRKYCDLIEGRTNVDIL